MTSFSKTIDKAREYCEPKTAKHAQIIKAAGETFLTRGYGTASMDEIARTANVSKATLYAYFASKEELFAAIIAAKCQANIEGFEAINVDNDDPRNVLEQVGMTMANLFFSREAIMVMRMIMAEVNRFPEVAHIFYESGPARIFSIVENILVRLNQRGVMHIPDTERAATDMIALLRDRRYLELMLDIRAKPSAAELKAHVAHVVDTFMRAYS